MGLIWIGELLNIGKKDKNDGSFDSGPSLVTSSQFIVSQQQATHETKDSPIIIEHISHKKSWY